MKISIEMSVFMERERFSPDVLNITEIYLKRRSKEDSNIKGLMRKVHKGDVRRK